MSNSLPHLSKLQHVRDWADRIDCRAKLPELTRRLIKESNDSVIFLQMASEEDVDLSGYDGIVEAAVGTPFVPQGRSVWEFGVATNPQSKAEKDYVKRSDKPLGEDPATTTFVFVTPRRWNGGEDWAKSKRLENKWKNVVVFTAAEIQTALETSMSTHIWFSEYNGIQATGATTLESWWNNYRNPTKGLLSPEIVLAGRREASAALSRILTNEDAAQVWINAPSVDDVLAFVACTVLTLRDTEGSDLFARSLVVYEPSMLRFLDSQSNLLIMLPFEQSLVRHAELATRNHVILHTNDEAKARLILPLLPIAATRDWLIESRSMERETATTLAQAAYRSVPLYRSAVTDGKFPVPVAFTGSSDAVDQAVRRRAWLIGGWNSGRTGDELALTQVSGVAIERFNEDIAKLATGANPLFSHVGDSWKVADIQTSFTLIGRTITSSDLQLFETVIQDVLGATNPALKVPAAERWTAGLYGTRRIHSSQLRTGIATTLAAFSGLGSDTRVGSSTTLSGWSHLAVRALLQRANEDSTNELWLSLLDVLSLLAEAAPDEFMDAVETGLNESGFLKNSIFSDVNSQNSLTSSTSPHVYFLWAFQALAWSPRYLSRSVNLLARLIELDPGVQSGNRPASTLSEILRPGIPQTAASVQDRQKVHHKLKNRHPGIAGDLFVSLLPGRSEFSIEGPGPIFHDWKPSQRQSVSLHEYAEEVSSVGRLAADLAESDPRLWLKLVDKSTSLHPEFREELLNRLSTSILSSDDRALQNKVWEKLDDIVRTHTEYANADWSLDSDHLGIYAEAAAHLQPKDAVLASKWLFDHHPSIGIDLSEHYDEYEIELLRLQVCAVSEIWTSSRLEGITELAREVKTPWAVGTALASLDGGPSLHAVAALLNDQNQSVVAMASQYLAKNIGSNLDDILDVVKEFVETSPLICARLLGLASDRAAAWDSIDELGPKLAQLFWKEFQPFGLGADFSLINRASSQLAKHGRHGSALDLIAMYVERGSESIEAKLVAKLLSELVQEKSTDADRLSSYEISRLLKFVSDSGEVTEDELVTLEWQYLPALRYEETPPTLARKLSTSPEFFVELISLTYFPASADRDSYTRPPEALISNAYRLLESWNVVPGLTDQGTVDLESLIEWSVKTRQLLTEADRLRVGEQHFGKVLAKSPAAEDRTWPLLNIRNFLEEHGTTEILSGFELQIYNNRGVTSRSLEEGGTQERGLANKYETWASECEVEWPSVARVFRSVASSYQRDAEREDDEAQRFLEGFSD